MEQHGVQQRVPGQAGRRVVNAAAGLLLLLGAGSARADNCEAIKAGIETRMRAGGLGNVVLAVTEPGAARPAGRVLGSCSQGTRQIVLTSVPVVTAAASAVAGGPVVAGGGTAVAPARSATPAAPADAIPTECKDGSIVIGPDCNDPRAVRMTRTEIDKLQAEQAERADKERAERAAKAASAS